MRGAVVVVLCDCSTGDPPHRLTDLGVAQCLCDDERLRDGVGQDDHSGDDHSCESSADGSGELHPVVLIGDGQDQGVGQGCGDRVEPRRTSGRVQHEPPPGRYGSGSRGHRLPGDAIPPAVDLGPHRPFPTPDGKP